MTKKELEKAMSEHQDMMATLKAIEDVSAALERAANAIAALKELKERLEKN